MASTPANLTEPTVQETLKAEGVVVPEQGGLTPVLCKPKLLPLKSITLQKLEEMEARIAELSKQQPSSHQVVDTMAAFAAAARADRS